MVDGRVLRLGRHERAPGSPDRSVLGRPSAFHGVTAIGRIGGPTRRGAPRNWRGDLGCGRDRRRRDLGTGTTTEVAGRDCGDPLAPEPATTTTHPSTVTIRSCFVSSNDGPPGDLVISSRKTLIISTDPLRLYSARIQFR